MNLITELTDVQISSFLDERFPESEGFNYYFKVISYDDNTPFISVNVTYPSDLGDLVSEDFLLEDSGVRIFPGNKRITSKHWRDYLTKIFGDRYLQKNC